jgi:uncharacterized membrane protein YbhN (UPF0104 family)
MMRRLRWPISLAVLATLIWFFEPARLVAEVRSLHPGWLLLALITTVLQTLLSAWRWRFTARRLGLDLPWSRAIGDYFLAGFANQTLPGGILGDVWRAQRHAADSHCRGSAWRAVLIERGSGQALVLFLSLVSFPALLFWNDSTAPGPRHLSFGGIFGPSAVGAAVLVLAALMAILTRSLWYAHWTRFKVDVQRALLAPDALPAQLIASLLIVFSYGLVFALAGLAIGVGLPLLLLLLIALPVLLAMLIPLSVAGWGWREAMAAGLWMSLGLPPEQGIAVSLTYGVIVALGTGPGLIVWMLEHADHAPQGERVTVQAQERISTSTSSSPPSS